MQREGCKWCGASTVVGRPDVSYLYRHRAHNSSAQSYMDSIHFNLHSPAGGPAGGMLEEMISRLTSTAARNLVYRLQRRHSWRLSSELVRVSKGASKLWDECTIGRYHRSISWLHARSDIANMEPIVRRLNNYIPVYIIERSPSPVTVCLPSRKLATLPASDACYALRALPEPVTLPRSTLPTVPVSRSTFEVSIKGKVRHSGGRILPHVPDFTRHIFTSEK